MHRGEEVPQATGCTFTNSLTARAQLLTFRTFLNVCSIHRPSSSICTAGLTASTADSLEKLSNPTSTFFFGTDSYKTRVGVYHGGVVHFIGTSYSFTRQIMRQLWVVFISPRGDIRTYFEFSLADDCGDVVSPSAINTLALLKVPVHQLFRRKRPIECKMWEILSVTVTNSPRDVIVIVS